MNAPCRAFPRPFVPFTLGLLALALPLELHAAESSELAPMDISASAPEADIGYQATRGSTASKSEVPLKEEAQSVQTVTPQLIQDYEVRTLDDAMKFISGVTQGNTLAGTKDSFIKRGFGNNQDGSIFRDGVRSNLTHNFDATAERVEVLKGPASLLYGALEPGGLINVVSKQPQYQQRTTLSGSAYSEGGGNLGLDTTGPLGDSGLAYRLVAERQHEDYWRNYGVDQHTLVAPSLSWTGERASMTLAYSYSDYTGVLDRGTVFVKGHPADIDYDKRLDESWSDAGGIRETASARFEYQLSDDWKTRLTYAWNNDRYHLNFAQPVSLAANGNFLRAANGAHYDDQTHYTSWDFIGRQELFGQRHDLLVGVDHEDYDKHRGTTYRNNATRRNINIYAPVYGNLAPPSAYVPAQSDLDTNLTSSSLYLKDNWHLDDRWILVLGGRYQQFNQYAAQGVGATRTKQLDKDDQAFVPLAGLVFQATDSLSLYGNYSRSFVPNTTVDDLGHTFAPEEGRSLEVGAKYDLTPGLNLNVALYDIEKKNVVTTTQVNNLSIGQAAGKVGSRGLELDLTGRLAERWDIVATYAYDHTEVLDDPVNEGRRLPLAPKHSGSLYLTHHLQVPSNLGEWHAGGGARYVGEQAGDPANSFYLSSYTVADAFLRWDLPVTGYQTRLQLNVDNLFDKHYYPYSANSPLQVAVGEPRTARLSASVSF